MSRVKVCQIKHTWGGLWLRQYNSYYALYVLHHVTSYSSLLCRLERLFFFLGTSLSTVLTVSQPEPGLGRGTEAIPSTTRWGDAALSLLLLIVGRDFMCMSNRLWLCRPMCLCSTLHCKLLFKQVIFIVTYLEWAWNALELWLQLELPLQATCKQRPNLTSYPLLFLSSNGSKWLMAPMVNL